MAKDRQKECGEPRDYFLFSEGKRTEIIAMISLFFCSFYSYQTIFSCVFVKERRRLFVTKRKNIGPV
jgi:hypothetical protein